MTPLVGDLPSLATKKQTQIKIGLKLRHGGVKWLFELMKIRATKEASIVHIGVPMQALKRHFTCATF